MAEPGTDNATLIKPFPTAAIKSRTIGGGRTASYVDGATVIRRLNEATGNHWTFVVDRYWIEGDFSFALATLTLPGCGSRQHIGVQSRDARSGEDAVAKGAITDALKKAATMFGVGLELYGPDHADDAPVTHSQPQGATQRPQPAQRPAEQVNRETGEIMASPRPQATPGQPATEKQVKFLHAVAKDQGLSHTDLHDRAVARFNKGVGDLDRAEISTLIDGLTGGSAQATPTPIRQNQPAPSGIDPDAPTPPPTRDETAWTEFWKWARLNDVATAPKFTELTQRSIQGLTPMQARELLSGALASMPATGTAGADRFTQ